MANDVRDSGRPRGERLDSWKAIAHYLQRDRSTVIRWERDSGLPVRRVPGGNGRSVFSYTGEIDDWLAAHGEHTANSQPPAPVETPALPTPRPRGSATRLVWSAALIGVLALSPLVFAWVARPRLSSARLVGRSIVGFDAGGRQLWNTPAPTNLFNVVAPVIKVVDIDRDGRPEALAALHYFQADGDGYGQVVVFDDRGRVRWAQSIGDQYRFGDTTYGPGWFPDDLVLYASGGATRLAAAFHHHTWWPDVIVSYDLNGNALDRFVHAGWVTGLNISADGRWLLASGVSNAHAGGMLTVLDAARISGSAPLATGVLPACENCPAGAPARYIVVPWSDIARPSTPPPIYASAGPSGAIELRVVQRAAPYAVAPELIVSLNGDLEVVQRGASDGFAETHRLLERVGDLRHAFADCPSRIPAVRVWTAASGWSVVR
jgi:hypothetical protein